MTTLKLNKKSTDQAAVKAEKAPVRRADPAKRPRGAAPVRPAADKSFKDRSPENGPSETKPAATRQRNHRYDGTLRDAPVLKVQATELEQPAEALDALVPEISANQQVPKSRDSDSRAPAQRPLQRGEFKRDEFKRNEFKPRESRPSAPRDTSGRDTPRRGGKARDGFEQGSFNNNRATNPMFSAKPEASNADQPRLSKRMAELGLCSRREADDWIVNGWVKVDGVVMNTLGTRIDPNANIEISKQAQQYQSEIVTILLNKPIGYVSGQAEDGYQPAIVLVHPDNQWTEDPTKTVFQRTHLQGLAPAGRLDIDSTGLLVLTQDGRVARHLIGEDSSVEKEYLVRVEGELSERNLKLLNLGLSLDGVTLKPAKVSWQNEDQLRFVLREGRKRQIRRMCELVGLTVVGLKRIRIGSVTLGQLPVGTWRYLRADERF
ncbi:MAG: pseudouridine synthase [Methylophilaceae bacterium]|nr:pseudouridine synthase [Methyloradius sp.]